MTVLPRDLGTPVFCGHFRLSGADGCLKSCSEPATYEAKSKSDEVAGLPPAPRCAEHAELARLDWDLQYIRSINPSKEGT